MYTDSFTGRLYPALFTIPPCLKNAWATSLVRVGLVIAAAASFGSADASPELSTTLTLDNINRTQSSTTTGSLSDSASGAYNTESTLASYGSATVTAQGAVGASPSNPGFGGSVQGRFVSGITVDNAGDIGATRVRITFHLNGNMTAYSGGTAFMQNSFNVNINNNGHGGEIYGNGTSRYESVASLQSFTVDLLLNNGYTEADASLYGYQSGSARDDGGVSASTDLTLTMGSFVALNDNNQPLDYTATSTSGSARGKNFAPATSYNGFTLANAAPYRVGSTLTLLGGTASSGRTVTASFTGPPDPANVKLASDAVEFDGTGNDLVVIQLNYSPTLAQTLFGSESGLRLAWLDPLSARWLNAVAGNSTTARHFFARAYNPATDLQLGNFGLDTANHVVWAVVNHNSQYGVSVVPVGGKVLSITYQAANAVHLQCLGEPNVLNRIESSPDPNAANFTTLKSIAADANGAFTCDDNNAGTKKFYRVAYP